MNRTDYLKFHRDCCDKMVATTARKNADYTGGSGVDNAFSNFDSVATWGVAPLDGFITRMSDKFARIATFVKKGVLQVKDESVEDTLLDLANYCILMAGYIKNEQQKAVPTIEVQANSNAPKVPARPPGMFGRIVSGP